MFLNPKEKRFKDIVCDYESKIFRLCGYYIRNREDRQDLVHDILLRIWKNIDTFERKSSLSTWIYRISINSCIDYMRGCQKRRKYILTVPIDELQVASRAMNAEQVFFGVREMTILMDCIDRLSLLDKTVISLYLEDVSYKEMADILGISEGHVGVKIHRIKKILNRYLLEVNDET